MIKSYQKFLESSNPEVAAICKQYDIKNWSINPDTGLVDVDGDVNLVRRFYKVESPRHPLHFGKVSGNFNCDSKEVNRLVEQKKLQPTMCGHPSKVFSLLEFAPKLVGGIFGCNNNKLKSLEGCPKVRNALRIESLVFLLSSIVLVT